MVSKTIRRIRCDDVLQAFMMSGGSPVFLTLTTADVCDYREIARRWRVFRHDFVRAFGREVLYIMNYELHPGGHGWHIHAVFSQFLPYSRLRLFATRARFGRIDFRRVTSRGVSDYLTKHCLKAFRLGDRSKGLAKRIRLVNCSRGLPPLSSYRVDSDFIRATRAVFDSVCRNWLKNPEDGREKSRRALAYWKFAERCVVFGYSALDWWLFDGKPRNAGRWIVYQDF